MPALESKEIWHHPLETKIPHGKEHRNPLGSDSNGSSQNLPRNFDRLEDNRMPERSIVIGLIKAKNPSQPAILMSAGLET